MIGAGRLVAIQLIVFMLGAVVMGFEMLATRYLYPYFGGSIETWGALIATVLAALMLGYFMGGYLADRTANLGLCALLVVVAALWIAAMPWSADAIFLRLMTDVGDGAAVTILASAILLAVPLAMLGTLLPFVIRVTIADTQHAGRVAGLSYAVSTFGSIFGTLFVTFTLIPSFGVRAITLMLAGACAVGALGLFLLRRR
ncbi:MAG TPA: fused MFS/spermidine synthase [Kiloniellales bacterium]|nr:fused MFS/spermidine synthase [Kiloniellales bacterium]